MLATLLPIKDLSFRNALYFLIAMPLASTIKLNIWVLELNDFIIVALLMLWLFRSKKNSRERRAWKYFRSIPRSYLIFIVWALFTITIAWNATTPAGWANMYLRVVKLTIYSLLFWIMITESLKLTNGYKYIFAGYIAGLALNAILILYGVEGSGNISTIGMGQSGVGIIQDSGRRGGLTLYNAAGSITASILIYLILIFLKKKSLFIGLTIFVLSICLLVGQSRGGWITLVFGLILIFSGTRKKMTAFLILFFIAIFAFNSPLIKNRLFTAQEGNYYDGARTVIAVHYLQKTMKSPVFGVGFFGRFYCFDGNPAGSHNQYIQVFYETGIIGLALYLNIFFQIFKYIKKIPSPENRRTLYILFVTQLFSVVSGEFWYAGSIWGAQIILLMYAILTCDRDRLMMYVNKQMSGNRQPAVQPVLNRQIGPASLPY
jgi:O-antigen ligase